MGTQQNSPGDCVSRSLQSLLTLYNATTRPIATTGEEDDLNECFKVVTECWHVVRTQDWCPYVGRMYHWSLVLSRAGVKEHCISLEMAALVSLSLSLSPPLDESFLWRFFEHVVQF